MENPLAVGGMRRARTGIPKRRRDLKSLGSVEWLGFGCRGEGRKGAAFKEPRRSARCCDGRCPYSRVLLSQRPQEKWVLDPRVTDGLMLFQEVTLLVSGGNQTETPSFKANT